MRNVQYISASAGSGKTYKLTHLLADAVRGFSVDEEGNRTPVTKIEPEQVILTTYTDKAAAEFREKAKAALHEAGCHEEAERLDQAMIGTVHGVADKFIQKYWYYLGISPELKVMNDDDKDFFINQSLASLPTREELRFLNQFSYQFNICYKFGTFKSGINYNQWQDDLKRIVDFTTNYGIKDYSHSREYSENFIKDLCHNGGKINFEKSEALKALDLLDEASERSRTENARLTRHKKIAELRRKVNSMTIADLVELRDYILSFSKSFLPEEAADFAHTLDDIWLSEDVRDLQLKYIDLLFTYAEKWRKDFAEYKRSKHLIDFNDMEKLFLDLLQIPEVAKNLKLEYKYLLVDEFQDSSPIQVRIFDRLSEIVDRSVWVGDYKQAIYGFRGADTELVKAVTDIIEKKRNGCSTDTLGISYRSYPEIVDVCNKVFVPVFKGLLDKGQVYLEANKKNKEHLQNLRVWPLTDGNSENRLKILAKNIAYEIKDKGKAPKDIAVLAYDNGSLDNLGSHLRSLGIPVLRDNKDAANGDETLLLTSLLSLLVDSNDELARAQIALLTEQGYDTARILDEKFELNTSKDKTHKYLAEIPLVKELSERAGKFRMQSVSTVVESIIIELGLYNVVARWENPQQSRSALHALIEAAREYEEHCQQLTLPATINGFIAYINDKGVVAKGDPEGVRLFTYHGSKGLEWDTVILLSLDRDQLNVNKLISGSFFGVQAYHETLPSADNLYPEMTICVLPWIYGRGNAPKEIAEYVTDTERFRYIRNHQLAESRRLVYVAMTRPAKELILAPKAGKNGLDLNIFNCIYEGTNLHTDTSVSTEIGNPLGINVPFVFETPHDDEIDSGEWNYGGITHKSVYLKGRTCNEPTRDIQPSGTSVDNAKIEVALESDSRLINISAHPDMAVVGSCIHDIFCSLDRNKTVDFAKQIINGYGLNESLKEPAQILSAWDRLENYLTENFGKDIRRYHELPFKQLVDGCIVTGSMDFVWKTSKGCILIDYKTFPGNEQLALTPGSHYAGNYKGQFDCYTNALEAAGETVIARYVYYPVTGMLVKI